MRTFQGFQDQLATVRHMKWSVKRDRAGFRQYKSLFIHNFMLMPADRLQSCDVIKNNRPHPKQDWLFFSFSFAVYLSKAQQIVKPSFVTQTRFQYMKSMTEVMLSSYWSYIDLYSKLHGLLLFHRPKSTPTPTASLSANGVPTESVDYDRLKQVRNHFLKALKCLEGLTKSEFLFL